MNLTPKNLPTPETLVQELTNLTNNVFLKISPENKRSLLKILSLRKIVPSNSEELGINPDEYIKQIPQSCNTTGWAGTIIVGVALVDMFKRDPSELSVIAISSLDTIHSTFVPTYKEHLLKTFSEAYGVDTWGLDQFIKEIARLQLGGTYGV